jgi:hypothetical protein
MKPTDNGKTKTNQYFAPDHNHIWGMDSCQPVASLYVPCLLHCGPARQPSEAKGPSQGYGGDSQIAFRGGLGNIVRR